MAQKDNKFSADDLFGATPEQIREINALTEMTLDKANPSSRAVIIFASAKQIAFNDKASFKRVIVSMMAAGYDFDKIADFEHFFCQTLARHGYPHFIEAFIVKELADL